MTMGPIMGVLLGLKMFPGWRVLCGWGLGLPDIKPDTDNKWGLLSSHLDCTHKGPGVIPTGPVDWVLGLANSGM